MVVVLCGDVCNVQRAVQQTSDGRVEREQAFAELEAAKTFADAHHGCCLVSSPDPFPYAHAREIIGGWRKSEGKGLANRVGPLEPELEKAWTNFTRDPRHRRHKCLTRNSVTYSVLAMRVYVQLETSSQRISSLSGRRERGESRAGNSTGNSAELRD